jgi:hypothetical protein
LVVLMPHHRLENAVAGHRQCILPLPERCSPARRPNGHRRARRVPSEVTNLHRAPYLRHGSSVTSIIGPGDSMP